MPISISELANSIKPERTILFLGAGASVPSGAPAGLQLAKQLWTSLARDACSSNEFAEICSILEDRYGRESLIGALRDVFQKLQPSGGLLLLPEYAWHSIFTTNYDRLVELAYSRCKKPIDIIRSNYDFDKCNNVQSLKLYKIHGCITQDIIDGSRSKMVLTEKDNEEHLDYREALFRALDYQMLTKDVLVIGHSLGDSHIRQYMTKVAEIHSKKGSPGKLLAFMYNKDLDRAVLWERKGFTVAFGGIDEFLHNLSNSQPLTHNIEIRVDEIGYQLPSQLRPTTIDVSHAVHLAPNSYKLFNGSPASYADIKQRLTFRRSLERQLFETLRTGDKLYLTITGAAGVGKTTLARRLLISLLDSTPGKEFFWESRADFPWKASDWREVEQHLRDNGLIGYLLIDDCPQNLRQINSLLDGFSRISDPALRLILTAETANWLPRTKSPELFSRGLGEKLSKLTSDEIEELVNLIDSQSSIRCLVDANFSNLNRVEQIRRLKSKCSADMFVCLKNIFATDDLDAILLREFAALADHLQDLYRHVSALEASGTRVHRQLIIRTLGITAQQISALLLQTEGLVDEYDISVSEGLFGWATRHEVVAQMIAKYKFSDQSELFSLLERVIDNINPTLPLEQRTLRNICTSPYGIPRITDYRKQLELFEKLIRLAPGERVPRHRMISTLVYNGQIDTASQAIRDAEDKIGIDAVICRYKVKLAIYRAEHTSGILHGDRLAILRDAEGIAKNGVRRFPLDKYTYGSLMEVGLAFAEISRDTSMLDEALQLSREAHEKIMDPQLLDQIQNAERERRHLQAPLIRV